MKITIFGMSQKTHSETIYARELCDFLERIKNDTHSKYILRFREMYGYAMLNAENYKYLDRIPRVCPACEYTRKDGTQIMKAYNGIVLLEVDNLNNKLEIDEVKRQASLLPQTLAAFTGSCGHSVKILVKASLPNGDTPCDATEAEAFHIEAYRVAVKCYSPTLSFPISISYPSLDKSFRMTVDDAAFVNLYSIPFVIEQPKSLRFKDSLFDEAAEGLHNALMRIKPGTESVVTIQQMFNACYAKAIANMKDNAFRKEPVAVIMRVADLCAEADMPEEEVVMRLLWRFYADDALDIRGIVRNAYEERKHVKADGSMTKKQMAALRLREFLPRRYEIRYNEILGVTEYRVRNSLMFMFKELTKRDLNTIKQEAALEGIEAFDSEVAGWLNSNYVPRFNPVVDYLQNVGEWDGQDRITELANMVPCDDKNWSRLFYRWFLSMVGHWMLNDTEHGNSTAPILIGAQGYRKSTFCRCILPPELRHLFTDSIDFRNDVEAERYLGRFLLVNIDEFDKLNANQNAFIKHLFQKPVANIRRSYSNAIEPVRRYASFIGTSNVQDILSDTTGNRRYICVKLTAPIQIDKSIDYKQLYAQAVSLINNGERYWLNDEDERIINQGNKDFESNMPVEDIFLNKFGIATEDDKDAKWVLQVDILAKMRECKEYDKTICNFNSLGRALARKGAIRKRTKKGIAYFLTMNK